MLLIDIVDSDGDAIHASSSSSDFTKKNVLIFACMDTSFPCNERLDVGAIEINEYIIQAPHAIYPSGCFMIWQYGRVV